MVVVLKCPGAAGSRRGDDPFRNRLCARNLLGGGRQPGESVVWSLGAPVRRGAFLPASPAVSDLQLGAKTRSAAGTSLPTPLRARTVRGKGRSPLSPSHPKGVPRVRKEVLVIINQSLPEELVLYVRIYMHRKKSRYYNDI